MFVQVFISEIILVSAGIFLFLQIGNFIKVLFKSEEYVKPVLDSGLADKQTLLKIQTSFDTWGEDPDIFAAEAWGEAVGWRE